ncbi:hypothetical protein [Thalassotalea piscium]|uniref:Uncharacterized protein n=1 Tax=Thalassotalea piscium TaxID=1230533 RepID=A0A7X0TRZ6_9GAMM|nr:hypothetical protein [Thalassotalea piscium]MBB6541545.1 hypothetical protein [Thalassotalea piscium]
MKILITFLAILACILVGLTYFKTNDQPVSNNMIEETIETKRLQPESSLSQQLPEKTTDSGISDEISTQQTVNSFAQLLEKLTPYEQEKYLTLNKQLFGALEFTDNNTYEIWLKQGFPSVREINYLSQYDRKDLGLTLFNSASSYPIFTDEPSLNLPALSAINLIETIAELETVVRYYFPEYQQGEPFPVTSKWPNGERPEQVNEVLRSIITSYASVREHTAIQYLARARYEQLSFGMGEGQSNATTVLTKLAKADKKLGGNNNLSNYVAHHYPEHIEEYEKLRNEKDIN